MKAPPRATPPSPQPRFDHLYVWMVDTFRADKMHAYNPKTRVQTPNYDAFAADATRYAWATVQGTWSLPSHASLLTGVYPTVHRATAHESKLAPEVPFVAEELKRDGYKTAMFSSNGYISSKWGFDRGWDVDRNFIRESLPNSADYLWKTAKAWIAPLLPKREFVYLATIEPHVAYTPKKEFLVKYWDKPYTGPIKPVQSGVQLGAIKGGKLKVNDTDKAYLEALHDAEITGSDALFAKFIADLKQLGLYDTSVVAVVSDHGDQFYEHGSVGHGDTVYQELTHVPLIVRAPGLLPKGHVVNADVEMMDMAPTLLDLAGAKPDPKMQGASLVPLALDEIGASPRAAHDRRRPGRARPEGRPLSPGPQGAGAHGALRRARRPARAEGRRRRAPDRPALDARRAGPAVRLRDHLVEVTLGNGRQRDRGLLRQRRPPRPPRPRTRSPAARSRERERPRRSGSPPRRTARRRA